VSRCAGAVRRSGDDNTGRPGAGRSAKLSLTESVEKRKEEIDSAARRKGAERDEARKVFELWTAVSCDGLDQGRRSGPQMCHTAPSRGGKHIHANPRVASPDLACLSCLREHTGRLSFN
jgi:hypothetical protein